MVDSDAAASIINGVITTDVTSGGDVIVDAQNNAVLNATSTTKSQAIEAMGAVVSLNAVGYDATNILFGLLDSLLGIDAFDVEPPSSAVASITDSTVTADGDVSVTATNASQLNAMTGNEQVSKAINKLVVDAKGKKGMSAGGLVAINKVATLTDAYITDSDVDAGGKLTVRAEDQAGIDANSKVVATSLTQNDLSGLIDVLDGFLADDYKYTTASGVRTVFNLNPLSVVSASDEVTDLAPGQIVQLASGAVYEYIGVPVVGTVDLGLEDFTDVIRWVERAADVAGELFLGGELQLQTRVRLGASYAGGGDAGAEYKYIGSTPMLVDLGAENYANTSRWQKITGGIDDLQDLYPDIGNLTDSDARAYGLLLVQNDLSAETFARVERTTVDAGEVEVVAIENTRLKSISESNVSASGGSAFGEGDVIALNGNVATNIVQSQATVLVRDSRITSTATGTTGDVMLNAENTSAMDARVLTTMDSGDKAGGITLAFNTMGWRAQNVLFNTLDALIGDPLIADAFGLENPARATVALEDTSVTAAGDMSVTANNAAQLNATVSNAANSAASALFGASGKAIGAAVAMNKVSSAADATIQDTDADDLSPTTLAVTGGLSVSATDQAGIFSNVKVVSSSITTNDGGVGVLSETVADFVPADFSTEEGAVDIILGERVRLSDDYANGGNAGSVYAYTGIDGNVDLSTADYSDAGFWKEVLETQLFPEGLNVTESDSLAIGGLVVLNEVRSEALARIERATVTAAGLQMVALENATIKATADSTAESSGGSAFGEGSSVAVNGTIATNVVLSTADAHISDSTVTITGDVTLDARNTSTIDARTLSATTSGDTGVSVTLAFNTIGWQSQNILFNTVDALIGDPAIADAFGNQDAAQVLAYVHDSVINAAGAISITATNAAAIDATVTNETESAAYALTGASSLAVGVVIATNLVNASAQAYIENVDTSSKIDARGGGITVAAEDSANIFANSKLAAISSTTNDAGISLLTRFADNVLGEYQFTDRSGVRDLANGDQVRLDDVDYTTIEEPGQLVTGDRIEVKFDLANGSALAGEVYEYIGLVPLVGPVDLDGQTYTDTALWKDINAMPGGTYRFLGGDESDVDLAGEDFTDTGRWLELISVDPRELIPGLNFNISESDSMAFGGLVVRNDARGGAEAHINNADIDAAGSVTVTASETATIRAVDLSTVTSSGGSIIAGGNSVAVNGVIATNLVLSRANAYLSGGSASTTAGGDVTLDASNTATIQAEIVSITRSNGVSIGAVMAFNTIGWDAQNILFNTVDAIVGTTIGNEIPVEVKAYADGTRIDAAGVVSVTALSEADID